LIKKVYKIYSYIAGLVLIITLLDRYAGKILTLIDPKFREMLKSKIKTDKATTKEQILHILKSNGSIVQETN